MSTSPESSEHRARRLAMRKILKSIVDLTPVQYESFHLKDLPIQVLPLALRDDAQPVAQDSQFFSPSKMPIGDPDPSMKYPSFSWPEDLPATPMDHARSISDYFRHYIPQLICQGMDYRHWPKDTPRNLYEHNELYQWRTTGFGDVSDGPRRKCIIMSNVDGDDRVLRGELVSICRIMIHILGRQVYVSHMVAPVMIFSFMGPHHGRILIAHYDGTKLIVRKSKLLDFKDPSSFKTLMPWWFSSGVGDTTAM